MHGDYLDTRIKNTTEELAEYDPRIDVILDQVFDEYGLIICGWSAEWDEALRAGLFDGSFKRFLEVKTALDEIIGKLSWW